MTGSERVTFGWVAPWVRPGQSARAAAPWWLSAGFTGIIIPADFVMSRQKLAIKERVASEKVRDQVDTLAAAILHGEGTTAAS